MIDQSKLIAVFESLDFQIQDSSFSRQLSSDYLKKLSTRELPNNDGANLLKHYPDLIVVNKQADPKDGVFYVISRDSGELDDLEFDLYKRYFPDGILHVFESDGVIMGKWLEDEISASLEEVIAKRIDGATS